MHTPPAIAALRTDRGPQRKAQAAMRDAIDAWRAEPGAAQMLAELACFGDGAPLEACLQLEAIFTGQGEGERLMARLVHHFCAAMAANPIGHPPFRNGFDGRAASILLARAGRAQLMLQAREPGEYPASGHSFSHALRYDAVLAGAGVAQLVRLVPGDAGRAAFSVEPLRLRPGVRLALDLMSEALETLRVERRLVVLRLLRNHPEPAPTRQYCPQTGALLHQSAPDLATSRQEAIVALLGRMGRLDAAPEMARVALGVGDASLRWQALREALALDTATGFAALCALARRDGDPLAAEAGALLAHLVETHPPLLPLKEAQCPV